MKKRLYQFAALIALTAAFTACGSDDPEEPLLPEGARIYITSSTLSKPEPFKLNVIYTHGVEEYGIERTEWIIEHKSNENLLKYGDFIHYLPGKHKVKANFYKRGQLAASDSITVTVGEPTGDFMFLEFPGRAGDSAYFENDTIKLNLQQYPRKNSNDNSLYVYAILECEIQAKFVGSLKVRDFFDKYMTSLYGEKLYTDANETGSLMDKTDLKYIPVPKGGIIVDVWRNKKWSSAHTIKTAEGKYYIIAR